MVVGGESPGAYNDVEVINMNSSLSECFQPKDCPLRSHASGVFMNKYAFVCNHDCYIYDSVMDDWIRTFSTNIERNDGALVQLSEDKFWIIGGFGRSNSTEICSPSNGCTYSAEIPVEYSFFPCAVKINETHIFLVANDHRTTFLFNQIDETFHSLPLMQRGKNRASAGFINGHEIVVAGGVSTRSSEIFDLDTNLWRWGPDLPVELDLQLAQALQFQDSFILIGGYDHGEGYQDTILKFNPDSYRWTKLPQKLRNARRYHAAFFVSNDYITCT